MRPTPVLLTLLLLSIKPASLSLLSHFLLSLPSLSTDVSNSSLFLRSLLLFFGLADDDDLVLLEASIYTREGLSLERGTYLSDNRVGKLYSYKVAADPPLTDRKFDSSLFLPIVSFRYTCMCTGKFLVAPIYFCTHKGCTFLFNRPFLLLLLSRG